MTSLRFRFRNFLLHFLASCVVFGLPVTVLYFGWYAWPNWYLMGAASIVGIAAVVDLCLGPLATLVVSDPLKPRTELRRDISVVVLIQFAALAYGLHVLWVMRPVAIVFSLDRAEVVSAIAISDKDLAAAETAGNPFSLMQRPRWVWAPLPDDADERDRIIASALNDGHDITGMPQYFQPISKAGTALREKLLPLESLRGQPGLSVTDYERYLQKLNQPSANLGALPIQGHGHDGAVIMDRQRLEPLAFWAVAPWGAIK